MSKPEFVYVTYIETTAEKLWHALTDGDFTERSGYDAALQLANLDSKPTRVSG